jgi:hypothetical protein
MEISHAKSVRIVEKKLSISTPLGLFGKRG